MPADESPPAGAPDPAASRDWWLRLQVGLGLGGGGAWFAGSVIERDFLAGVGCGLLIAALVLRLGRTRAERV